MTSENNLVLCYNRGCGQKFDPNTNTESSCTHHPGNPFFHDAYKGWSCCNKKCTDFTEFLNIKGCTIAHHSNIKPPEPVKQEVDQKLLESANEIKSIPKPIVVSTLERPSFDSPLTVIQPQIAASLKQEIEKQTKTSTNVKSSPNEEINGIKVNTPCKNSGCNATYQGPDSDLESCVHHPGYPVFHEGLKFWSCCTKRTSDFNAFLNQVGCETTKHVWSKDDDQVKDTSVKCRWDWHQTGTHVIVTVYAKQYCPTRSTVKLNPIRLALNLIFPQQSDAEFNLDLELRGIVDVTASKVQMFGTKVEVNLRKAEPGSWAKLDFPRAVIKPPKEVIEPPKPKPKVDEITPELDAVDLSDL